MLAGYGWHARMARATVAAQNFLYAKALQNNGRCAPQRPCEPLLCIIMLHKNYLLSLCCSIIVCALLRVSLCMRVLVPCCVTRVCLLGVSIVRAFVGGLHTIALTSF